MNALEKILYDQVRFDCEIFNTLVSGENVEMETIAIALSDGLDAIAIAEGNGNCEECKR